ncbi:uncharacterized protein LOC100569606 isoform X1 [Acyrthosiphon pisum]|uniref:DUF4485 domain-containing protein n=2 Tax=Acyrthosiphon pisum TaxID=7029 RepID=A0A8R2AB64_ACYPI|nr:uncharacterized protein LOC100569606 isoform X1 [Acyrthosiphon pisum]|eukprot:XP_003245476.1 PREDICTED: uncharacterized protein LOC100569606 isoform X1 [Acyrthosiphon pisum]
MSTMEEKPEIGKHTASDVLTQHFFLYISHIKRAFDNFNQCMDKTIVQAWINKLMECPHPNNFKATKRNMYLAQLLIHLYDGKLRAPFTRMPSNRPLETFDELPFYGKPDTLRENNITPEVFNQELPLDELNYISSDERTYIAIQSLNDGFTVFGYVAVTIGHVCTDPMWLNSRGETIKSPIPTSQDLPVSTPLSKNSQELDLVLIDKQASNGLDILVKEIWDVLSGRHNPDIRERAGGFYLTLYTTIQQEMLNEQNNLCSTKFQDPFVNRLIFFLVEDLMAEGVRDTEAFHRFNQLSMLKKRIKAIIVEIETRRRVFEEVKKSIIMPKMQFHLHSSINCSSVISEMILQETLKMGPKSTNFLFTQYPLSVVQKFKIMIVNEKKRIMQLIKIRSDSVTGEMYKDLRESIRQGLRDYQAARNEWLRAWRVIKEYEEALKIKDKLTLSVNYQSINDKFLEIIKNEIDIAKIRYKKIEEKNNILENEIYLLNKKIHEQNNINVSETTHAEERKKMYLNEITNKNIEIQLRIATIDHLKSIISID